VRNLQPLALEPRERFNVFSGDNGQGKTNLLETIFELRDTAHAVLAISEPGSSRWDRHEANLVAALWRRVPSRSTSLPPTS
jgi:recombinational DNA repair ATPase RecF